MKLIFMGTAGFGVPALKALDASSHQVCAVYSKAPRPAGRRMQHVKSPIHTTAEALGLEVFCPTSLRNDEQLAILQQLQPDAIIVAAYGLILNEAVLGLPRYGCINLHPSALPRWRGAAPVQHTILSGDQTTAMCIMQMDSGIDTGAIWCKQEVPVEDDITAAALSEQLSHLGAQMLLATLKQIESGQITMQPQAGQGATYARKLTAADEVLNFNQSAYLVNCQVRALSPRPGAYLRYGDEIIKVITADCIEGQHQHQPGMVVDQSLRIACKQGFLQPTLLQRQGRKMIYTEAFLRGFPIPCGTQFDG